MRQTMVDAFRNARFFHYFRIHEKLNETPEKPTFEKRRRKSLRIRVLWHRESGSLEVLRRHTALVRRRSGFDSRLDLCTDLGAHVPRGRGCLARTLRWV